MFVSSLFYYTYIVLLAFFTLNLCAFGAPGKASNQGSDHSFAIMQREIDKKRDHPHRKFQDYLPFITEGPVIPGLFQGVVPQGKAFLPEHDLIVISNYMTIERAAALTLVSMHDGELKDVLWVYNHDGSMHRGHVGGLAATRKHLWLASGKHFYRIPLQKIIHAEGNQDIHLDRPLTTEVKCSFATASDDVLYIGEFRLPGNRYITKASHIYRTPDGGLNFALMAGFQLNEQTDHIQSDMLQSRTATPSFFVSLPDRVQGVAFIKEHIVLSKSYGRRNTSHLSVHLNPVHTQTSYSFTFENGKTVPVWHLDSLTHIKTIGAPPMTEGITNLRGELGVLFESGANKYRLGARYPQDRIHLLDMGAFWNLDP
ncbi:MAG: hypothetical protein ACLFT8_07755 [Desulfovermiculus sp.]